MGNKFKEKLAHAADVERKENALETTIDRVIRILQTQREVRGELEGILLERIVDLHGDKPQGYIDMQLTKVRKQCGL